jgi:hypothetical protein
MSDCDDLHAGTRLPEDDHERKPPEHHSARPKIVKRVLLRISVDLIDGTV